MDEKKLMEALEYVLLFNKKSIIGPFMGEKFSDEEVERAKQSCELLSVAGVYQFDINCSLVELLIQIEKFIEDSISDSEL